MRNKWTFGMSTDQRREKIERVHWRKSVTMALPQKPGKIEDSSNRKLKSSGEKSRGNNDEIQSRDACWADILWKRKVYPELKSLDDNVKQTGEDLALEWRRSKAGESRSSLAEITRLQRIFWLYSKFGLNGVGGSATGKPNPAARLVSRISASTKHKQ